MRFSAIMLQQIQTTIYLRPQKEGIYNEYITHNLPDDGRVSRKFVNRLLKDRSIHYNEVDTLNDMKLFQVSMIQDLNFPAAFRAVIEMGVVAVILGSMPGDQVPEELAQELNARLGRAAGLN